MYLSCPLGILGNVPWCQWHEPEHLQNQSSDSDVHQPTEENAQLTVLLLKMHATRNTLNYIIRLLLDISALSTKLLADPVEVDTYYTASVMLTVQI